VIVRVLLFAAVRERAGRDELTLELPDGSTVADATAALGRLIPGIAPMLSRVQMAVNRTMARPGQPLSPGDEMAVIPPVAGGSGRRVAVVAEPLSLHEVLDEVTGPAHGGVVTFTGHVRREGHEIKDVVRLEYEAYVPMAEEVLRALVDEVERDWPGTRVAVHHRTGSLTVGEVAVAIAVAAPHRAEAFEACRATIDRLKDRAPIWKKEIGESGAVWLGMGP
jgi:MoaE-MoaD fusion protein